MKILTNFMLSVSVNLRMFSRITKATLAKEVRPYSARIPDCGYEFHSGPLSKSMYRFFCIVFSYVDGSTAMSRTSMQEFIPVARKI
jgi:hypothetical protein